MNARASLKDIARKFMPRSLYLWLANRYRSLRRLFAYPDTAHVGVTNYDEYWENKAASGMGHLSAWRLRRAEVFARVVAQGDRVMDIGAGDGALLKYLIDRKNVEGYGVDISPRAVDFCRQQGLRVTLVDANTPPREYLVGLYDYVILSEIIEHLPEPEKLLNDLRPHLRKGLLVSIPNTGFIAHRLRLLFGRFPLQWVVTPGEHLRFWTRADFHWWARQMGFEIVQEFPYEGAPGLKAICPGLFAAGIVFELRDLHQTTSPSHQT